MVMTLKISFSTLFYVTIACYLLIHIQPYLYHIAQQALVLGSSSRSWLENAHTTHLYGSNSNTTESGNSPSRHLPTNKHRQSHRRRRPNMELLLYPAPTIKSPLPGCSLVQTLQPHHQYSFTHKIRSDNPNKSNIGNNDKADEDEEDDIVSTGVGLTIFPLCSLPSHVGIAYRSYFRIYAIGPTAMTALKPVVLHHNDTHVSAYMRLPDSGSYQIHVKLAHYNYSADMVEKDWPNRYVVLQEDVLGQAWINKDIVASPTPLFNITSFPSSAYNKRRLPLCWSLRSSSSSQEQQQHQRPSLTSLLNSIDLSGRWLLGPPHEHITHQYPSNSIFDDYYARWLPYDCIIDYSLDVMTALQSIQWLHIIGDSNMRALFHGLCTVTGGRIIDGDPAVSYMDLPKLCITNSVDNSPIVTYTNWFYVKNLPLDPNMTFAENCALYTEHVPTIERAGRIFGWPGCQGVHPSIQSLHGAGLTYFGWGNHQAEMGASIANKHYFEQKLFGHSYWSNHHGMVAYTEDVNPALLSGKWTLQYIFRNNPRIIGVNHLMAMAVINNMQSGHWLDSHVTNQDRGYFLPVFDVFSMTHAASEYLHGDTVHFWNDMEKEILKLLIHYIIYAPQLPYQQSQQSQQTPQTHNNNNNNNNSNNNDKQQPGA